MTRTLWLAFVCLCTLAAADCGGGDSECNPPDGVRLDELYCRDGERGLCREGGHPGDTVWEPDPCPEGQVCQTVDGDPLCAAPERS